MTSSAADDRREVIRKLGEQFTLIEIDVQTWKVVSDPQVSIAVFVRLPEEMMNHFIWYHSEREFGIMGHPAGLVTQGLRLSAAISSALLGLMEAANTRPRPGMALLLSPPQPDQRPGRGWISALVPEKDLSE